MGDWHRLHLLSDLLIPGPFRLSLRLESSGATIAVGDYMGDLLDLGRGGAIYVRYEYSGCQNEHGGVMELDLVRIIDITGVGLADGVRLGLLLGTLLGALVWPILGHSQRVMQWVVVGLLGGGGVRLLTVLPFFVSNTQSSLETAVANPDLSVVMMGSAVVDLIAAVAVAAGLGALLMIVLAEIRRALVGAALGFFIGPGVGILLIIAWASHPVLPLAWLPVLVGAALVPLFLLLATHIDVRAGR